MVNHELVPFKVATSVVALTEHYHLVGLVHQPFIAELVCRRVTHGLPIERDCSSQSNIWEVNLHRYDNLCRKHIKADGKAADEITDAMLISLGNRVSETCLNAVPH